jgi:hypothetical protein
MKKSFIYGIPIALMLAALSLGCESPTSSEDNGGPTQPKYEEITAVDVYSIAAAFDEGQNPVYVAADIRVGNEELSIPAGKTLDFVANNKDLLADGLGETGKLILAGDIVLRDGANYFYVVGAKQKLITTLENINKYVEVLTNDPSRGPELYPFPVVTAYADNSKKIKTTADNVVLIQNIGNNTTDKEFTLMAGSAVTFYDSYLALNVELNNGYLTPTVMDFINTYYNRLKTYITNGTVLLPDTSIKFTGGGNTSITPFNIDPTREASRIADSNGFITFSSGVVFDKASITLNDTTRLSIKGVVRVISADSTTQNIVSGGTLEAYTVKFDEKSTPTIDSVASITGSLPNNFGAGVTFTKKAEIFGPAIINTADFQSDVTISGLITLAPSGKINLSDTAGSKNMLTGGIALGPGSTITGIGTISGIVTGDKDSLDIIKGNGSVYSDEATDGTTPSNPADIPLTWITLQATDAPGGVVNIDFKVDGNLYVPSDVGASVEFRKGLDLKGKLRSDIPVSFTGGTVTFHSAMEIPADKVTFSNPTIIFKEIPAFTAPYSIPEAVSNVVIQGIRLKPDDTEGGTYSTITIDTVSGFGANLILDTASQGTPLVLFGKVESDNTVTPPAVTVGNLNADTEFIFNSDITFGGNKIIVGAGTASGNATFTAAPTVTGTLYFTKSVTWGPNYTVIVVPLYKADDI